MMSGLSARDQRHLTGTLLAVALFFFHCVWFSTWLIEDAAISFAFAENAAAGEGFVPYPGGEPVEGFSNPTWTLLLTVTAFLGLSTWTVAKVAGVAFGAATIPLATLWARRLCPDDDNIALIAPLALAMSTQHALWASSGLENGIFSFFLAASVVRVLYEGDAPRLGWSGALLAGLACSRPEAPMYAGLIALFALLHAGRIGGVRWLVSFVVFGALPFGVWHAWRIWYFAWELPNTFYAKEPDERFAPFAWKSGGWRYLRGWALVTTHGFVFPLFIAGQVGLKKWRAGVVLGLSLVLFGLFLPGLGWLRDFGPFTLPDEPERLVQVRVVFIAMAFLVTPWLGLGRPGARVRILTWGLVTAAVFFAVYTGGDWMRGYRWLSLGAVPLTVLLADAARLAVSTLALERWRRGTVAVAVALPVLLGGVGQTTAFLFGLETSPFDVRRRVLYMRGVQERLHLDHASLLEVDMGAHMYWSGFELTDIAGLVNVPIARHHYPPSFVDTYIHEDRNPTFAHVHGQWGKKTRINLRPWFRPNYVEIPGFGHTFATKLHRGNHVRKDLFVAEEWPGSDERSTRFGPVQLDGLETPWTTLHPGGTLYVELGWSLHIRPRGFRAILFLAGEDRLVTRELPPAYDWLPVRRWRRSQSLIGRHTLTLPPDLPTGTYSIGLVVVGDDSDQPPTEADPAAADPRYMAGEARWDGAIRVVSREAVEAKADGLRANLLEAAQVDCERAEQRWEGLRRAFPREDPWHTANREAISAAMAACWGRAAGQPGVERSDAVQAIRRARQWNHREPSVESVGATLAETWVQQGDAAAGAGNVEEAHRCWTDALAADPSRTWVRRRLEQSRAKQLREEEK